VTQKPSALVAVSKVANVVPPFICPITSKEMSGTSRFVYPPCGCVISEEALREVKAETCLVCGKAFDREDVIPINSTDPEEIETLRSRMDAKQALREAIDAQKKAAKAKKKRKSGTGTGEVAAVEDAEEELSIKKKTRVDTHLSNINMALPNLSDPSLLPPGMRVQSEAVKSLFVKKDKDGKVIEQKNNFLVRGTFNRFAASF
jgi:hypothetical protein